MKRVIGGIERPTLPPPRTHRRPAARRSLLLSAVAATITVATVVPTAPPAVALETTYIDFEASSHPGAMDGADANRMYEEQGVILVGGAHIAHYGENSYSGSQVLRNAPPGSEFCCHRMLIRLDRDLETRRVAFYATSDTAESQEVVIEAHDPSGRVLDTIEGVAPARGSFQLFEIGVPSDARDIFGVEITYPQYETVVLDDLTIEGEGTIEPPDDGYRPWVSLEPAEGGGTTFTLGVDAAGPFGTERRTRNTDIAFRVSGRASADIVAIRVTEDGPGSPRTYRACPTSVERCPLPDQPSDTFELEFLTSFAAAGTYRITVEVFDARGRVGATSRHITLLAADVAETDVWVLGLEYNQGYQHRVYVDLNRGAAPGYGQTNSPATDIPVIRGKPMVVRVFVGVRPDPDASVPPEGVATTGFLRVNYDEDEPPRHLDPLDNASCADHRGSTAGQACLATIRAYAPMDSRRLLSSAGIPASTDYDLDLISARASWEGTLNFVVPASITARAADTMSFRAFIRPIGRVETRPADNVFRLDVTSIDDAVTIPIHVSRISAPGFPAPTQAATDEAVEDLNRMLLFQKAEVQGSDFFSYTGTRLRVEFMGNNVKTLDQCTSLWPLLLRRYGLDPRETVLGFFPTNATLTGGCEGMGWRVVQDPWDTRPDYLGGIGYARLPVPAAAGDAPARWDGVAVVAQELFHAHFDTRHLSNDHGEDSGCTLSGILADVVETITAIDTDCFRTSHHPDGTIGQYPGPVELDTFGRHLTQRVIGFAGGVGVAISPATGGYDLALYDPCPTGPLDRRDPLTTFLRRWDEDGGVYACEEPDEERPHDFMSYGENGWLGYQLDPLVSAAEISGDGVTQPGGFASGAGTANLTGFGEATSRPIEVTLVAATKPVDPGLSLSGLIVGDAGPGLLPLLPRSTPAARADPRPDVADPTLIARVDDLSATTREVPLAFGLSPGHGERFGFFDGTLPSGSQPERITLELDGKRLATFRASATAPTVRITSPSQGDEWTTASTPTVAWEAHDPDGDRLTFVVQHSTDGESWREVGITDGRRLSLPASVLSPSEGARIRVTASDGMRLGSDVSRVAVLRSQGARPATPWWIALAVIAIIATLTALLLARRRSRPRFARSTQGGRDVT